MEDIYLQRKLAVPLNEQGIIDYWNDELNNGTIKYFDFPPEEVKAFYGDVEYAINKNCGTAIGCCEPGTIEAPHLKSCLDILSSHNDVFPVFCEALKLALECNTCVEVEI